MSETEASKRPLKRRRTIAKVSSAGTQNRDRWILSYADFITLLFAFFVALYALSGKESGEGPRLKETLHGVFEAVQKSIKPINIGEPVLGKPKDIETIDTKSTPSAIPIDDDNHFSPIYSLLKQTIENESSDLYTTGQISISESADWVNVELNSALLFGQGEYDLTNEAVALLMLVASILKEYPTVILVEGDTDDTPVSSRRLVSNWHLSSLRSSSVVEELVYQGIDPKMIAPVGFSSEHPKVNNVNAEARQQNRRVVLRISKRNADNIYGYLFK